MSTLFNESLLHELSLLDGIRLEDRVYQIVLQEIQQEQFDPVAKVKAYEEAEGDNNKARALYTKHRVRRIDDMLVQYKADRIVTEKAELKAEVKEQFNSFLRNLIPRKKRLYK
ncbi:hypothetical protein N9571_07175, partial [Yoonia sp.]|nr:hypothetical protein [Yoonia sp.]